MGKSYKDQFKNEDGVWRTIGGRKVFIRTGQSLSDAMIESGKFKKNIRESYRKAKEEEKTYKVDTTKLKGEYHKLPERTPEEQASDERYANAKAMYKLTGDEKYKKAYQEEIEKSTERIRQKVEDEKKTKLGGWKINEEGKKINETMDRRASIIEKLDNDTKDLNSYDKYNLAVSKLENNDYSSPTERQYWSGEIERYKKSQSNDTFEVGDLKRKALETLPKDHIDSHEGDLYIKKTPQSTELLNRMKDKDSGLLSTFKDQQTGEEWYDIPFANMEYDYKEKAFDNEATKYYSKLTQYQTREDLDMRKRWLQDNVYDESKYKEYEDFYRQGEQYYENKYGVDQKDEDYSKVNENARISFGKVDAYGSGRKNNEVTIEMELKDGRFSASGKVWNSKHTDIISGGQNLDEIKEYLKGNKDYEKIYNMWQKHHLNDMHAGTEKQEEALNKKFGGVNPNKYDEQVAYLKSINLYEDNGYRFGSGWLKRDIPQDDLKEITKIIRNSNYRKDYDEYLRTHKNSTLSFEEFKKWFK